LPRRVRGLRRRATGNGVACRLPPFLRLPPLRRSSLSKALRPVRGSPFPLLSDCRDVIRISTFQPVHRSTRPPVSIVRRRRDHGPGDTFLFLLSDLLGWRNMMDYAITLSPANRGPSAAPIPDCKRRTPRRSCGTGCRPTHGKRYRLSIPGYGEEGRFQWQRNL